MSISEIKKKLIASGFVESEGSYVLSNDIPYFDTIDTPQQILINLDKQNFVFNFADKGLVDVDWSSKAESGVNVYGRDDNDSMCVYNVDSSEWLDTDCGLEKESLYINCYTAFLTF